MFNGSSGFNIGDHAQFNNVAGNMHRDTHHHYSGSGTVNHVGSVGNAVFGNNYGTINQGGGPPPAPRPDRRDWYPPRGPGPRHQEPPPHMGPSYPDEGYWDGSRYGSGGPSPQQQYRRPPSAPPQQQYQQPRGNNPYGGPAYGPVPHAPPQHRQHQRPQQVPVQHNSAYMMQQQFNSYHGPPQGRDSAPYQEQYAGNPPPHSYSAPPAMAEDQRSQSTSSVGPSRAFDEIFSDMLGPESPLEQERPASRSTRSPQPAPARLSKRSQRATVETEDEASGDERRGSGRWVDEEMEDLTQGVNDLNVNAGPSSSKRPPPVRKDSKKLGRTWYGKKKTSRG